MSEGIAVFILTRFLWSNRSGFKSCVHIQVGSRPNALWTILGTLVTCGGFPEEAWKGGGADSVFYGFLSLLLCLIVCCSGKGVCCSRSASLLSGALGVLNHSVLRSSWLLSLDFSPPLCCRRAIKMCLYLCK